MNIVALIGNAASDPELRYTAAGKAVCNVRIAVNRGGGDEADFFTVVCWERQAEVVNEYVQKGRKVGIEGRLAHKTWEAQDGSKRSAVEIVAHRVELLGSRDAEQQQGGTPAGVASDDDIPF